MCTFFVQTDRQPKLITIDEQTDDDVMHLDRLGKTDRLTGQPCDPCTSCHVFALDLLGVALAGLGRIRVEMARGRFFFIRS